MTTQSDAGLYVTGVAVSSNEAICPVCGQAVDNNPRLCQRCETPHHQDCWEYTGGCAIFGCVKGEIRPAGQNAITPHYEKAIRRWMMLYRLEGLGKAAAAADLVLIALSCAFASFAGSLNLSALAGLLVGLAGFGVLAVYPLLLFFLLLHPFLWWYGEKTSEYVGQSNVINSNPPNRQVIDRLDLPTVDKVTLRIVRGMKMGASIIGIVSIMYMLCSLAGGDPLGGFSCLFLAIFAFIVFPTAKKEFEERATTLASLQNRLIASLKGKS